ncbi:Cilia- and flagella-associated protein 20 [Sesamum alatum]|uniref:Cilia- and flagella-associated protein 20 n=4 Tax=Sesamum TaxID=4181 RepID=A0AAE1XM11_9LAMI|nr:Cilia- and flagella-associated protein 20 [Sesamum alatum]
MARGEKGGKRESADNDKWRAIGTRGVNVGGLTVRVGVVAKGGERTNDKRGSARAWEGGGLGISLFFSASLFYAQRFPKFSFVYSKAAEEMFKNTFQSGFLSILYSLGSKPLQIWDKEVVNGQVKRLQDDDIQSNVLEIVGSNVQSTYITCPADPTATLGIKLPFLVMIVKNMKKYFTFEIQVLDDKNVRRRFRASNFQAVTRVKPYICTMPLKLDEGWNQVQLNLTDLTRRAYGTNYVETLRVQVHASCRLRRIYFSDRLYSEEELPPEFKLYLPMQKA